MKNYFYPKSIYNSILAFSDQFNDMSVRVFDPKTGKILGAKPVVLTIAPKEKLVAILSKTDTNDVDPQVDNYLPRISINQSGIAFDPSRASGKFDRRLLNIEYDTETGRKTMQTDLQPAPWNLTFEVTLWAKYDIDMKQMLENILPWFAPENHISIKERDFGIERKCKVTLDSTSFNNVFDLGETDRRVLTSTISFTMETFLYKPMEITKDILCSIVSIYEVPCNSRIPVSGSKIIAKPKETQGLYIDQNPEIKTTLLSMDAADQYQKSVTYWRYANNNMAPPKYWDCLKCSSAGTPPQVKWDPESTYQECSPPIRKPYMELQEDGKVHWYYQAQIVGKFAVPDYMIDGYSLESLPPLEPDDMRIFGKDNLLNVWHFKKVLTSYGDPLLDNEGREVIYFIHPDLYPTKETLPQELKHLGDAP